MRRAGAAVAEEVLRRFPDARSFAAVCGGGANGGDGRIAAELLRAAGWEERALGESDVVIDALFGTGFRPPPRESRRADSRRGWARSASPVVAVDIPSGVDASTGEVPKATPSMPQSPSVPRAQGGARGWLRGSSGQARSSSRTSGWSTARAGTRVLPRSSGWFRGEGRVTRSRPARCWWSAGLRE